MVMWWPRDSEHNGVFEEMKWALKSLWTDLLQWKWRAVNVCSVGDRRVQRGNRWEKPDHLQLLQSLEKQIHLWIQKGSESADGASERPVWNAAASLPAPDPFTSRVSVKVIHKYTNTDLYSLNNSNTYFNMEAILQEQSRRGFSSQEAKMMKRRLIK